MTVVTSLPASARAFARGYKTAVPFFNFGGFSQGAGNVAQRSAYRSVNDFKGRGSDGLDKQCNSAGLGVGISDCQGDAFSVCLGMDNDKLTRLSGLGDARSANNHAMHIRRQCMVLQNFEHVLSSG